MPQYLGTEGELISVKDAQKYTCEHLDCKDPNHNRNFIEAEFFGLKTFKKLLKECGGEPVGFRVYYGIRHEDHTDDPCERSISEGGKPTPRLIIVPVDKSGIELTGLNSVRASKKYIDPEGGLKDMGGESGRVMANGPICPKICGGSN